MIHPQRSAAAAAIAAAALVLAACSPGSGDAGSAATSEETEATGTTTVTVRLWDDVAAPAYEESFDAFMAQNPDIVVEVEVIPWADYWTQLPLDLQAGEMADIFWTNSSNFAKFADNGNLINISDTLGDGDGEWTQSVVDLYTRDGALWGVPQLWDSIGLNYNKDLTDAAGIDPADLTWAPGGENDTLLTAARALTTDAAGLHPARVQPLLDRIEIGIVDIERIELVAMEGNLDPGIASAINGVDRIEEIEIGQSERAVAELDRGHGEFCL